MNKISGLIWVADLVKYATDFKVLPAGTFLLVSCLALLNPIDNVTAQQQVCVYVCTCRLRQKGNTHTSDLEVVWQTFVSLNYALIFFSICRGTFVSTFLVTKQVCRSPALRLFSLFPCQKKGLFLIDGSCDFQREFFSSSSYNCNCFIGIIFFTLQFFRFTLYFEVLLLFRWSFPVSN